MSKIRVAVLRGGPSSEYDVSLKTGESVLKHLSEEKYAARDVFIDKSGIWHVRGLPVQPISLLRQSDVVVNGLHGEWGEDGQVQRLLETFRVPYTGSGPLSSAIAMNKLLAKQYVTRLGIKTPPFHILDITDAEDRKLLELFRTFPQPSVIKPINKGSSVGVTVARSFNEFVEGVRNAFSYSSKVLLEAFIRGKEATVGVIDRFRGKDTYSLLPVEIIPPASCNFFDYHAKYSGESREECPGNFSSSEKSELMRLAEAVHQGLGLRHYSRSDFIVSPRGIYFLEANTLPGLTSESLLPKSLTAVGSNLPEFLDHIITLAMERK